MKALIACEYSGALRSRLRKMGIDAFSCDILPAEDNSPHHIKGDALNALEREPWDLVVAFPPCTFLTVSGNRWFYHPEDKGKPIPQRRPHPNHPNRRADQTKAAAFFMSFVNCGAPLVAVENPIGVMSTIYRKPDQIIQPWQFGHGETKATCLWLSGLPRLVPTSIVREREGRIWKMPPGPDRQKERSRTFAGVADAMADQWGAILKKRGEKWKR